MSFLEVVTISCLQEEAKTTIPTIENAKTNAQSLAQTGSKKGYAKGTRYAQGGLAWVGEEGPELIDVPEGSKVYTAEESERMASGDNFYVNVTIDAKNVREFNDVIDVVRGQRVNVVRGLS
ncbi:MAG: hypothetical protein HUJ51_02875 [Eggerthellaceae bacterium]|nr:hypothetical protein [Eggerthellaceae bacterium]